MSEVEPEPPDAKKPNRKVLVLAVVAVLVVAAGVFAVTRNDSGPSHNDAVRACQTAVRDKLKSPSTARFEADKPAKVNDASGSSATPGAVVVEGTVDSQNGFGATVRGTYFCIAKLDGGRFTVEPESVFII